jgi:hypothetical protein
MAAGFGGGRAMPGPPGSHPRRPFLQQRRAAFHQHQVAQRDIPPYLQRLPGPFRHQPGRHQALHSFLEGIVIPLVMGAIIVGAGRGGQGVQHGRDELRALGRQVTA